MDFHKNTRAKERGEVKPCSTRHESGGVTSQRRQHEGPKWRAPKHSDNRKKLLKREALKKKPLSECGTPLNPSQKMVGPPARPRQVSFLFFLAVRMGGVQCPLALHATKYTTYTTYAGTTKATLNMPCYTPKEGCTSTSKVTGGISPASP